MGSLCRVESELNNFQIKQAIIETEEQWRERMFDKFAQANWFETNILKKVKVDAADYILNLMSDCSDKDINNLPEKIFESIDDIGNQVSAAVSKTGLTFFKFLYDHHEPSSNIDTLFELDREVAAYWIAFLAGEELYNHDNG